MKIHIRIKYQPPNSPCTLNKKIEIEIPDNSQISQTEIYNTDWIDLGTILINKTLITIPEQKE